MTAEMPVLAARARKRPSSIARIEACSQCWNAAEDQPYHASLVIVVNSSLPSVTNERIRLEYVDYTAKCVVWYRAAAFQLLGRRPEEQPVRIEHVQFERQCPPLYHSLQIKKAEYVDTKHG